MFVFNIVISCHMVAGDMDQTWSLEKWSPPLKGWKKA